MIFTLYRIHNSINTKNYIGITSRTIEERFREHLASARGGSPYRIHAAIRKYGAENFNIEALFQSTDADYMLFEAEPSFIKTYNSFENGYNATAGGVGVPGLRHSDETRAKMSALLYERDLDWSGPNNPMYGKRHSEESKAKMSEIASKRTGEANSMYGKHHSDDGRKNIGDALKSGYSSGEITPYMLGKSLTPEAGAKVSAKMKGKISRSKQYWATFPDGHYEQVDNMAEFCRQHGLHKGNLCSTVSGALYHYKGFRAAYLADGPKEPSGKTENIKITKSVTGQRRTAKSYVIIFPDGHQEQIVGMTEFCRQHGLTPSAMSMVVSGKINQHKGFKARSD